MRVKDLVKQLSNLVGSGKEDCEVVVYLPCSDGGIVAYIEEARTTTYSPDRIEIVAESELIE